GLACCSPEVTRTKNHTSFPEICASTGRDAIDIYAPLARPFLGVLVCRLKTVQQMSPRFFVCAWSVSVVAVFDFALLSSNDHGAKAQTSERLNCTCSLKALLSERGDYGSDHLYPLLKGITSEFGFFYPVYCVVQ
uniref:Uncharacterized protein n=1 Tax=Aegilops tauschii subsp. strangulata TaxID=200361 RepID=A0A453RX78_AEGTS